MALSLDALWVVVSASLVFVMQAGFLCIEAGSTRRKNNINVAIKNISDLGLSVIVFWACGYGLMFGTSINGYWGVNQFLPEFNQPESWPLLFFLFQAMFCSTAVTIVSGAIAERMTFKGYLLVTLLVSAIIYPIFGHWAWNGLDRSFMTGWLGQRGFIDFAGSTVVHSVGGWVALAAVIVIGPRLGRFSRQNFIQQAPSADIPLAFLGTLLLWFGWFGFNGGSTFAFNDQVPRILVNTLLSGSAGLTVALLIGQLIQNDQKPTFKLIMNGSLAGLVAITANCHTVSLSNSLIIGGVGSIVMIGLDTLLEKLHIDDAVGAIPVHLGPGIWGTLAVALFGDLTLIETGLSRWEQLRVQLSGVLACGLWAFSLSLLMLLALRKVVALRVSHKHEYLGLNMSEHGACNELNNLFATMQAHAKTGNLTHRVTTNPLTEVGQISHWYNQVVEALERSIARTNAIIITAVDGIITVNPETLIIQSTNPAVETIFGSQWLKLIGQPLTSLIGTDFTQYQDAAFKSLQQLLEQGCQTGEIYGAVGLHQGGQQFPVEIMATDSQIRAERFCTITVRDITNRKAAEAALMASELEARNTAGKLQQAMQELKQAQGYLLQHEKMASLGQLVAGVAHEINNPLSFIYGNLEHVTHYVQDLLQVIRHYQMQSVKLSPKIQAEIENSDLAFIREDFPKLVHSMQTGAERIQEIVQSLKNFVRHNESDLKVVDVHEGLENTLMVIDHQLNATSRRPAITLHKMYGELPKIECYAGALNQVFFNLFNNAIDVLSHHSAGKIIVKTEAKIDCLIITISDNGEGIPKALQQQIFDPFFTTKPVGKGTGMGLAISHQIIVEKHGGQLQCHSVLGQGTTFKVILPKTPELQLSSVAVEAGLVMQ